MIPILFALVTYFAWGTGDIFGGLASRQSGSYAASIWSFIFRLIIFSLAIPFAISQLSTASPSMILLNFVLGSFLIAGLMSLNQGMKIGNPSIIGTIAASYAAVAIVLSLIFLRESLTLSQVASILVIFIGVVLVSLDFKSLKKKKDWTGKGIGFALLAVLFWGIYFTFIRIPSRGIGWFWTAYISYIPALFILGGVAFSRKKLDKLKKASIPLIVLQAVIFTAGDFSYYYALSRGLNVVVAPVAGSYPTFFVVLASLVFKEKVTKQQILGIIVALAGIVFLSFTSA